MSSRPHNTNAHPGGLVPGRMEDNMRNKTTYGYAVKIRFHSDLHTQPEWVTVSAHTTLEGAERELAWQMQHGGPYLEAKIFPTR